MILYYAMISIYFVIGCVLLLCFGPVDAQLWVNQFHYSFFDIFFKYLTHLGDGWIGLMLLPIFLYYSKLRTVLLGLITCLLASFFVQFAKKYIFGDMPRPTAVIPIEQLHLTGIYQLQHASFPSGHNTFIFAFMTFIVSLCYQSKILTVTLALITILIGFSRVYLQQHWIVDSLAGELLGIFSYLFGYYIVHYFFKKNCLNQTFPSLISRKSS